MKRSFLFLLSSFLLAGCESTNIPDNPVTQIETQVGGQTLGDTTSVYWYTHRQNRPIDLSEHVWMGDYGDYESVYRWRAGKLREVKRTGQQLQGDSVKPFSLHVRYDTQGKAVFQRYLVDDIVLPLSDTQLHRYTEQAARALSTMRAQNKEGQRLVQGQWRDGTLVRCDDGKALKVTFTPALPDHLNKQLAAPQGGYFIAVVGKVRRNEVTATELLLLQEGGSCLVPPPIAE
ncbi:DUF1481 domain-containing protein [Photobacterium swingsii]|uniref:DUF1481 domain-containing protein n=1 Tax=Photobacterium swingsii TaxID=680026 RepID=A0A2T3P1R9_9GAMM|nr:DUF1481 domain-containing protein [Photobacterium swingsii]PSW22422.1 DUF1481 domain-containing protein [Photobacterium swingsii]